MAKVKTKYNKTKFYLVFAIVVAVLAGIAHLWNLSPVEEQLLAKRQQRIEMDSIAVSPEVSEQILSEEELENDDNELLSTQEAMPELTEEDEELIFEAEDNDTLLIDTTTDNPWANVFVSSKVWSYPECFPDSNATQLIAAEANGIKPAPSRDVIMKYVRKGHLTDISTSPYYIVEDLTHSMPYLVPKAQNLLNTIGINFVDSLHSKGYPLHIPVVTSVQTQ